MADDFTDKLNAILGNPEAMSQIMSIAQSLTGNSSGDRSPEQEQHTAALPPAQDAQAASPPPQSPDLSELMAMLGNLTGGGGTGSAGNPLSFLENLDPKLVQAGMRLLSEMGRTDDRRTSLLAALKPFVKEERYAKVDRAVQAARLSRVIRMAYRLFREGGGEEHV